MRSNFISKVFARSPRTVDRKGEWRVDPVDKLSYRLSEADEVQFVLRRMLDRPVTSDLSRERINFPPRLFGGRCEPGSGALFVHQT